MKGQLLLALLAVASCALIEQDPNIAKLFETNFVNSGAIYTSSYITKIVGETGNSKPPIFDSFNDPDVRQQLRKNVLLIINTMLSMQQINASSCVIQRINEAKAIRDIYIDDTIFNNRPLPRYYHVDKQKQVQNILDSMLVKWDNAAYPGAWFATGFYQLYQAEYYSPVFSFGSELELPLNEVSNASHYIAYYGPANYYGLGRMHNISVWKDKTDLISWGVEQKYIDSTINYIKSHYDEEKTSFLLSKLTSIDQIVLERQLLTIAHAHTNDRANALAGSLIISDWTRFNSSAANVSLGQILLQISAFSEMYYGMIVSVNYTAQEMSFLTLHVATRQTIMKTVPMSKSRLIFQKYVPDIELKDMTVLTQLIVDGALLDQPPSYGYSKLIRSVKQLMTRVT